MGGFLGIGNSSAKTDRSNQLAGINADWNVYNRGLPLSDTQTKAGQGTTTAGLSTLDSAKQYWQNIMSGNKTAVQTAAAPAVNAVNAQGDAQRTEAANMGTSRGGGTNATQQGAETQRMTDVNNAILGQQPEAAKNVQSIGTAETQVGNQQMMQALQSLGLDANVAQEIINSSIQSRPISIEANQAIVQQWSNALSQLGLGMK